MSRRFLTALFAVVLGAVAGWALHSAKTVEKPDAFAQQRLALLESENERLRAQVEQAALAQRQARDVAARQQIERGTAAIRQLSFKTPVQYDVVTRAGIRQMLEEKLGSSFSAADFQRAGLGYSALGLIPPGYDLQRKYLALLSEQVAAFYDQHARKLYMFADASLDSAQNKMILSHELTHALQDQNFGIKNLPLEVKDNDDLAFATSALIEGDATVEMTQFMAGQVSVKAMFETIGGAFTQNMTEIQTAPRFLREMLLAPYTRGQLFVMALMQQGGWDAVSEAFRDPPRSSTEILHPEKFLAQPRWRPTRIEWADTTFRGQKPAADNVLGELGIRLLLSEYTDDVTGAKASEGWQGDRYLVFDKGQTLVWRTQWESEDIGKRFRDGLVKAWASRSGHQPSPFVVAGLVGTNETVRFEGVSTCIFRRGNFVVLVQAGDVSAQAALIQQFAP